MTARKPLSIAILTILASTAAHAQDLKQVDVIADKTEVHQTSQPAESTLNTSNSETGTTLRQLSGVGASRMGGHGVELVVRGQKESQLNVLIDGAKIEGGCPNRMDPPTAYAEMSSIDQVTVIKGVQSVTLGSGGTGGTVLFERMAPTFEEGKPYQGEINLGTSSNGVTRDMNATVAAGGDKGYIVVQGSRKSADNYKDGNGEEVRSSYESQQGHIDLGWTPNDQHEVRLSHENTLTEDALFQGAAMDSPKSDGTTTRLRYMGENLTRHIQSLDADIYSSDVDHLMDNYSFRTTADMMKRYNKTNVKTQGAKIEATSMISHNELKYGVQLEGIEKNAQLTHGMNDNSLWFMWPDVQTQTRSIFAESTSFFKDNQKVILGLRYDQYETEAKDATRASDAGKVAAGLYNGTYADYSGETETDQYNWNALARYEKTLNNGIAFYAGVSSTHRYPDATELYIAKGGTKVVNGNEVNISWVGNPDLNPEQHNQLDIGFSQQTPNQGWSVSAYYDAVNDYILRDQGKNQTDDLKTAKDSSMNDLPVARDKRNVYLNKDAVIMGMDVAAHYKPSASSEVGFNASLTRGENTTDSRNLSNMSPLNGNLYAELQRDQWVAGARFNFAAEQTEVNEEYGELETAAWSTVDVYGQYQINKQISLSAGVDNLFDHAYENYLNRIDTTSGNTFKLYEPGLSAWAKLNAKF